MDSAPGPSDPFYELMRPPLDETLAQATVRQQREREAQARSDEIDESIRHAREIVKKEKNVIKVLLLGQSESGKSTTLKNFRMRYARDDWEKERNGWRVVVQLNIVRSIITILGVVETGLNCASPEDLDDNGSISPAEPDAELETPEFGEEC